MTATITTLIPTFRRPALLARAIRSVLDQTYRDCAVAVFDNASGDETADVVARLAAEDPRITYHRHERDMGIIANFVHAMAHVESPFFSVLSDDDLLFPEFFDTAMPALARHPEAMFFAGSTLELDDAGRLRYAPLAYWPREGLYQPRESLPLMLGNRHPTFAGVLMRRTLIDAIGNFDPETGTGADFDYEARAAARFPIVVSFQPCAAFMVHPGSQSGGESAAIVPFYEKMMRNIEDVEELPDDLKRAVLRAFRGQLRGKLLEISVKAQVRGDATVSREAASRLRDTPGARLLGRALQLMGAACTRSAALQRLLVWLESRRVQMRAATSRRRAGISDDALERYAAWVRRPIALPNVSASAHADHR